MASALCRQLPSPLGIRTVTEFAELSALTRDLDALVASGLLEAFEDENNVIRYRPIRAANEQAA